MSEHDLLTLVLDQLKQLSIELKQSQIDTAQRLATLEAKLSPLFDTVKDQDERLGTLEAEEIKAKTGLYVVGCIAGGVGSLLLAFVKMLWNQ